MSAVTWTPHTAEERAAVVECVADALANYFPYGHGREHFVRMAEPFVPSLPTATRSFPRIITTNDDGGIDREYRYFRDRLEVRAPGYRTWQEAVAVAVKDLAAITDLIANPITTEAAAVGAPAGWVANAHGSWGPPEPIDALIAELDHIDVQHLEGGVGTPDEMRQAKRDAIWATVRAVVATVPPKPEPPLNRDVKSWRGE